MQLTLVQLFINKLYDYLQKENLTFKKITFANGYDFSICSKDEKDAILLDKQFLLDNIAKYFYKLVYNKSKYSAVIFHELLEQHPHLVYTSLLTLPISHDKCTALNKLFTNLNCIFSEEDFITYLTNYKEKSLKCGNYHYFKDLLKQLHDRFHQHVEYKNILLHNFKINRALIRKKNGNIIGVRTWVINNLDDISFLEEFLYIENENPLFHNVNCHTTLKFLDVKVVQSKYFIKNAKGIDTYYTLLKSLINILNSNSSKTQLLIDRVESNFAFDKTKYQLTIFSKESLNSNAIEKTIDVLLKAICDYYNLGDNKPEDFESVVFKVFQYYNLNEKLTSKNQKTGKVQKI